MKQTTSCWCRHVFKHQTCQKLSVIW